MGSVGGTTGWGSSNANNSKRVYQRGSIEHLTTFLSFYAISEPLTVQMIGGGNDYADWIAAFPGVGANTGFEDDPDGDGNGNGLENFFGTAPDVSSSGLTSGAVDTGAGTFTFTHPQSATPADDSSAPAYTWSTDLATFNADGAAAGGSTVDFVALVDTPSAGITTVTATVTGTSVIKLFVRVGVTQMP